MRASDPAIASWNEDSGGSQAHGGPTTRELVPQETFRPARQQKEHWDSQAIEFSAHGGKGVRLSDALDGNWGGLEGRDDRSLFGNNRPQIVIRLRVRLPRPLDRSLLAQ